MSVTVQALNFVVEKTATFAEETIVPAVGADRKIKLSSLGIAIQNNGGASNVTLYLNIGQARYYLALSGGAGSGQLYIGGYDQTSDVVTPGLRPYTVYERHENKSGYKLQEGLITELNTTPSATPTVKTIRTNFPSYIDDEIWLPSGEEISWECPTVTSARVTMCFNGVGIER
jgi:hypothetical protein